MVDIGNGIAGGGEDLPLSAYTPDPVTARKAGLYVCGRLPKAEAVAVLEALGLVPYPSQQVARRGPTGRPVHPDPRWGGDRQTGDTPLTAPTATLDDENPPAYTRGRAAVKNASGVRSRGGRP